MRTWIPMLLACLAAGCGSDRDTASSSRSTSERPERVAPAAAEPAPAPWCPRLVQASNAVPTAVGPARERVEAAALRATRTGHRFATDLAIHAGAFRATARVEGRRLSTNASAAALRWSGVAGVLLDDLDLRIVGDTLYVSREGSWRALGSASGVALDVGRELVDHPHLLVARSATERPNGSTVTLAAPAARLRAYATTERRGPVTDLLRATRLLTLLSSTREGRLWTDSFQLDTALPASVSVPSLRTGTRIRVTGRTTYCALRPTDRAAITAPSVVG